MVGRLQIKVKQVVFGLSLLCFCGGCKPAENTADFFYSTDSIQSGDIILRKGYGLVSEIIVYQMNDTIAVSHCGIISMNEKGNYDVIHSLSKKVSEVDGMQICSLAEFVDDSKIESVRVFRYKAENATLISQYAAYYLQQKNTFDEHFDMTDTTSFYCLELPIHIIHKAFKNDVSHGVVKPLFSLFLDKDNFTEVIFVKRKSHLLE